jgi:Tfp pilus assembly protein PilF
VLSELSSRFCTVPFFAIFVVAGFALAQTQQQPTSVPSSSRRDQQSDPQAREPGDAFLFLTGDVLLADGSTLDEEQRVEMICGGRVEYQTSVSVSGRFTIELGKATGFGMTDASVGRELTNPGSMTTSQSGGAVGGGTLSQSPFKQHNLSGCEVRLQAKPGYYSEGIRLGSRSSFDSPEIGTIVLHRLSQNEGTTVSVTTLEAPAEAKRALGKAQKELGKKRVNYSKANKELEKAVKVYPQFAAAWDLLGQTRLAQKDREGAKAALENAIKADPAFMNPYLTLARMELYDQQWAAAAARTTKLMELNTRIPQAFYFHGLANFYLGGYEAAEKAFLHLEQSGDARQYPMSYLQLGIMNARQGEIPVAAKDFSRFLRYMPPDQVSAVQRQRIERQLNQWDTKGAIDLEALEEEIDAEDIE